MGRDDGRPQGLGAPSSGNRPAQTQLVTGLVVHLVVNLVAHLEAWAVVRNPQRPLPRVRVSSYTSKALLGSPSNGQKQGPLSKAFEAADEDINCGKKSGRANEHLRRTRPAREQARFKPLTREQAQALRAKEPSVSPWRVIAVQVVVGLVVAAGLALVTGQMSLGWSALYGATVVVVPGALMARGMTSKLTSVSPGASAVSFMFWQVVKIAVSVALLMLAPKLVQPLSWPALLAGLVLCMKVYWLALLWRGRPGFSHKQ
jgi:ATP synthase protein I